MSSGKSEFLHFDGLLLSKSCTVPAKKSTKEFLMALKSDEKFKEKLTCIFKQLKSLKISLCSFCPKYKGLR